MATPAPNRASHGPWGVPESLTDLHGPTQGEIALPLHLCWSGLREFDVTEPSPRLLMYQWVITEGDRSDIEDFLDADYLLETWPWLRRLLHPRYVRPWEERFPELARVAEAAEPAIREELRRARQAVKEGLQI